ncbi:MAG: cytochrome oxidase putative small subunit CydP [Pseudomonadota bacterium]
MTLVIKGLVLYVIWQVWFAPTERDQINSRKVAAHVFSGPVRFDSGQQNLSQPVVEGNNTDAQRK